MVSSAHVNAWAILSNAALLGSTGRDLRPGRGAVG